MQDGKSEVADCDEVMRAVQDEVNQESDRKEERELLP